MSESINWSENAKFVRNAYNLLDGDFQDWWIETEGLPPDRVAKRERSEYWDKCEQCLIGWHACREILDGGETKPLEFE